MLFCSGFFFLTKKLSHSRRVIFHFCEWLHGLVKSGNLSKVLAKSVRAMRMNPGNQNRGLLYVFKVRVLLELLVAGDFRISMIYRSVNSKLFGTDECSDIMIGYLCVFPNSSNYEGR